MKVLILIAVAAAFLIGCGSGSGQSNAPVPTAEKSAVAGSSGAMPSTANATTYTYGGCVVYGSNDWFTTNLIEGGSGYVTNTVDSNSAAIISNFDSAYGTPRMNINGSNASIIGGPYPSRSGGTPINVDNTNAPLHAVQNINPALFYDPYNNDSTKAIPWSSTYKAQGSCPTVGQDCHDAVIDTNKCIDYETYWSDGPSWNGSTFSAHYLIVHDLKHPYNSQDNGLGVTKAGFNYLGIYDTGDDVENYIAKGQIIPHIVGLVLPGTDGSSNTGNCATESCAVSGHVAPASAGFGCAQYCTNPTLPAGARLRLNQSKLSGGNCNSAYPSSSEPQANAICLQLATYGAIVTDHGSPSWSCNPACSSSDWGIELGPDHTDRNPWDASDLSHLDGLPFSDFDVMTLGATLQ